NKKKMKEFITSTLIDYGIPKGDSSMARTVSLPLAIGVKLILTGKITLTGIQIPIMKEIYDPVLNELENMGIKMVEKISPKNSH
ncbi:MAG TPA: saccharopine dehydrogenase, partial [Candidatus Marinimicrobia bacterium]|nr:saccharopine dehydrogenase [Candidatus Neomarinimicrobiota bacterium]